MNFPFWVVFIIKVSKIKYLFNLILIVNLISNYTGCLLQNNNLKLGKTDLRTHRWLLLLFIMRQICAQSYCVPSWAFKDE